MLFKFPFLYSLCVYVWWWFQSLVLSASFPFAFLQSWLDFFLLIFQFFLLVLRSCFSLFFKHEWKSSCNLLVYFTRNSLHSDADHDRTCLGAAWFLYGRTKSMWKTFIYLLIIFIAMEAPRVGVLLCLQLYAQSLEGCWVPNNYWKKWVEMH